MSKNEEQNLYGLSSTVINKINEVFSSYQEIDKVLLYGSRAKGTYKQGSDIDLTIQSTSDIDYTTLCRIKNELDDLNLPYLIDLSIFSGIDNPDLIDHIKRIAIPFYQKLIIKSIC